MFLRTRRRVRPRVACLLGRAPLPRLLPATDGLLRPPAGTAVRLRALPVDGQAPAMANSAIGADLRQALDRLLALTAEVSFDLQVAVDVPLKLRDLLVGEIAHLRVGRETEHSTDLLRRRRSD